MDTLATWAAVGLGFIVFWRLGDVLREGLHSIAVAVHSTKEKGQ